MKKYLDQNVYDAAQERLDKIFDNFEHIYVSFSSGKDSGVLLNLCIDKARERGRKIGCMFIDLEAYCHFNIEYVNRMFEKNKDVLDIMWICLPMRSPNGLSFLEPVWTWWDKEKEPVWVRPMPENEWVINENNNPMDFWHPEMTFEAFITYVGKWYGKGEPTACLVGIRTDESLNRFRAIVNSKKTRFNDMNCSTKMNDSTYNFYPLYDWCVEDIWTYNAKYNKDYNHIYDMFYKAGVSIHKMRVDEPFGNEAKAGLNLFRVIDPEAWARVVNRVSGANFGNIYSGSKISSHRYTLPKNHTWKSFTKFLLSTLPQETADNYRRRFIKFIKYWHDIGCPVPDDKIKQLEKMAGAKITNTHEYSTRGNHDKYVIKFNQVIDELPGLDSKKDFCTWKRMAMCIIKNDFICKGLSFSITKDMTARQEKILKKYKHL